MFFKHFASKIQQPGLSIIGTLIENELNTLIGIYWYYHGKCSSELDELLPLPYSHIGQLIFLIGCIICLPAVLDVTRMSILTVSIMAQELYACRTLSFGMFGIFIISFGPAARLKILGGP